MVTGSRVGNQKKWGIALLIFIGLSIFSCSLTFGSVILSEDWLWLTIFFGWVNILLFSAAFLMFIGLLTGNEFPFTGQWWVGTGPGCLIGGSLFIFVAITAYSHGHSTYLNDIACFGTMMGLMGFYLGAWGYRVYLARPRRLYHSKEVWVEHPPINEEDWHDWLDELMADADDAMAQLEQNAQVERVSVPGENELPKWRMGNKVQKTGQLKKEASVLDKFLPTFLLIFVLIVVLFLIMLVFLRAFI